MTSEKRLVILGSSEEFTDLVQLAVSRGIYTVAADGYKGNPAKKYASRAYDCDIFDVDAVAEICRRERADHILTAYSDVLFEQSVLIADRAGLPYYLKPEQLPQYREKDAQKALLEKIGIPVTRYRRLRPDFGPADLAGLRFPLVLKPIDGYGSKGIRVVHNEAELRGAFAEVAASRHSRDILAEEYCTWPEYNSMAWLADGKVYILSVNDRERVDQGPDRVPLLSRIVYPSRDLQALYEPVREIYSRFAAATGQKDGPLAMQFFWKPGEKPVVCEMAGRCLAYEHELFGMLAGLSLPGLFLDALYDRDNLHRTLEAYNPFFRTCGAGIYWVADEGEIRDMSSLREIAGWEGVKDTLLYMREGDSFTADSYYAYVVRYFIQAESRRQLDDLTRRMYAAARADDAAGRNLLKTFSLPEDRQ